MENKPVGMAQDSSSSGKGAVRYCAECGAKVPRTQKVCPACGEMQA